MQELKSGTLLQGGKYVIKQVLGQGGFGIMYLAHQESLGRDVAVKEFFMKRGCERGADGHVSVSASCHLDTVSQMRHKFLSEAKMLASIEHPHIVNVIDVWEENETVYYSMPYLSGGSLKDKVMQHGPLDEETALCYVSQIARAIKYLHDRHICHYDIKPGNILLDNKGNAVLIDFGNSRNYGGSGEDTLISDSIMPISKGYAPIEQYSQITSFSPKCDIYALGATLYFLLTKKVPPAAETRAKGDELVGNGTAISSGVRLLINDATRVSADRRLGSIERFISKEENVHPSGWLSRIFRPFKVRERHSKRLIWIFVAALVVASVFTCLLKFVIMSNPIKQLEKDMVLVEGGTFMMGALDGDTLALENEKPPHRVSCASFYICKYEVTQELWEAVMGENPSNHKGKRFPVENVTYYDCLRFIDSLNAKTHMNYRLPTEIEWEFAARGGKRNEKFLYSGSNRLDAVAWNNKNSRDYDGDSIHTHEIGGKDPNSLRLYDMTGNVMEWTSSEHEQNEKDSDLMRDPEGFKDNLRHTMRGGSCHSDTCTSRVSCRKHYGTQNYHANFVGLRLVRSK